MFERGPARRVFDPGELAPPGVDGDEGVQASLLGLAQRGRHLSIERLMDLITPMTDQTIQRLKRWQLNALLNEMLDGYIKEVGGVAHGIGGLRDTLLHHARPTIGVGGDGQRATNEVPIARAQMLLSVQRCLRR
jgi:hypothetical protein